jgi:hypothetical protein
MKTVTCNSAQKVTLEFAWYKGGTIIWLKLKH